MSIHIDTIADIDKLIAFLRVGAKGKFNVPPELIDAIIDRVVKWAKSKNIRVAFQAPGAAKCATFTAGGAALGLIAGIALSATVVPLVAAGLAGAATGFAASHLVIEISPAGQAGASTVTIV